MTNCDFCDIKITPKNTMNLHDSYLNEYKACKSCGEKKLKSTENCQKMQNLFLAGTIWLFTDFLTLILTLDEGSSFHYYIAFISQVGLATIFYGVYIVLPTRGSSIYDL